MALTLTQDETMLTDAVRGLLERAAPISAFRSMRDAAVPEAAIPGLFAQLAENGLIAPHITEENGGIGMGASAIGLIAQAAAHTLGAAPMLGPALAATLIQRAGDPCQRARWLPAIVAGETVVAAALDETPRHDPERLGCTAHEADGGWTLSGFKTMVIDGFGADAWIVSALADDAPGLFFVSKASAGVKVDPLRLIDSRDHARLTLDDASAERLAGGDALDAIAAALDIGRAVLAAELLGIADEAFDRTLAYLKERKQFGRVIGSYQALQHRAARLYGRLDLGRGVVLKALRAIDEGASDATLLASLSKAVITKLARDVLVEAMQMHGGIGVTDEFDIGLFVKRARVVGDLLGDDHFHTDRLARERWGL